MLPDWQSLLISEISILYCLCPWLGDSCTGLLHHAEGQVWVLNCADKADSNEGCSPHQEGLFQQGSLSLCHLGNLRVFVGQT